MSILPYSGVDSGTSTHFLDPPEKKFSAKSQRISPEKLEEYIKADEFLKNLLVNFSLEPLQAASVYFEQYPHVPPFPLRPCRAEEGRDAWRMFNRDKKPMTRLFGCLDRPHFYTLHAEHLDLPPAYGDRNSYFYDRDLINGWKSRLKELFTGPFFWKLEVSSRIHCHVIAVADAGLLDLPRTGEVVKPIQPGTELTLVTYLCKPRATSTVPNLAQWIHTKRQLDGNQKLPHLQGHVGLISARRFWAN